MTRSEELAGKVALVTGSAQGIGAATARRLAAAGARVAIVDRQIEKAQAVAAGIAADGGEARAFEADIRLVRSLRRMQADVHMAYGPVEILVNNAAHILFQDFLQMSWEAWDLTLETNLSGSFYCSRVFIDDMIALGQGNIIIMSSVNGLRAQVGLSAYNVTKAGLIMLAQTMALELAPHHIRVNAVAPGDIATAVIENVGDEAMALRNIPLRRWGTAEEVAETVLFLASERSSYVTGSVIGCDGGLAAQLYPA